MLIRIKEKPMETNKIYLGNNLDTLKTFPDNSINCCVTSPPYYGLRDYGTGHWEGGDPNCNHKVSDNPFGNDVMTGTHKKMKELGMDAGNGHIMKRVCTKCGATRIDDQVGLEDTPEDYIQRLVDIFSEIHRCMTDDGTLWINIGDTYNSSSAGNKGGSDLQRNNVGSQDIDHTKHLVTSCKPKDMIGIPWMLAFALRNSGWYLRQDIIWHKPAPMPESVQDRFTKSHEYIFLFTKSPKYYFDHDAIQEDVNFNTQKRYEYSFNMDKAGLMRPDGGLNTSGYKEFSGKRNKRDVWTINTSSWKGAHFATFPEELVHWCIVAGCPKGGVVLDPFMGSGTVGVVAKKNNRKYIGCELNPEYKEMADKRISVTTPRLF